MQTVPETPAIRLTTGPLGAIQADMIVIPVFEDDELRGDSDLQATCGAELTAARGRGEFSGKQDEHLVMNVSGWVAPRVVLVGAGPQSDLSTERLRRVAMIGGLVARQRRASGIALVHRGTDSAGGIGIDEAAQALAEGGVLASFDGATLKTKSTDSGRIEQVAVRIDGDEGLAAAGLERGRVIGGYTNIARGLANEPGNRLTPTRFAEIAARTASHAGLSVEILDERRIAELNMGLLLGVARGSQEPPRVVVLRYEPKGAMPAPVLGLVGKGVTFDSGGISIKPAEHMDLMKSDMSGGAAVLCAMAAMAAISSPTRCIGVIPLVENMPGGRALKPGDVLTSAEGKTVEVLNTDAEGRLALGDGLWYARQLGATHLVDVATLTGACIVALGKSASGLFGRPDSWRESVQRASERAGERTWPLPLFEDYKELFRSEIADFANSGGRAGGAITGALFIQEFAGDLPWAHLDVAGPAWAEEAKSYQPKGATGVGVRTLVELARAVGEWAER